MEQGLRTAVRAMLKATTGTGLRGMSGVNLDHRDTTRGSLVLDKRVELIEAPTMQLALVLDVLVVLAASHQARFTDVGEVLQDDSRALWGRVYNVFRKHMVMVFASPKLFAAHLLEVSLGRAAAFGLQLSFQTEGTPFLFFPPALPQEVTITCDGGSVESQVYTSDSIGRGNIRGGNAHHDMQGKSSLAIAQVRATRFVAHILHQVRRHGKGQFNTARNRCKAYSADVPLHPIRTLVIADTAVLTHRTRDGLEHRNGASLLLGVSYCGGVCFFLLRRPPQRRLDGFRRLDASGTHQLGRQVRMECSQGIVRLFVQLHPIARLAGKAKSSNGIETRRMFIKRSLQDTSLLIGRMQVYHNRSIHTESISYMSRNCNTQTERNGCASSPCVEAQGSLHSRIDERFKVERASFLASIQGITVEEEREQYSSFLLIRLMFLYFLQQRGFLAGDVHYLSNRLQLMQKLYGKDTFYRCFLLSLFANGLGAERPSPDALLGTVPALDKRLFRLHQVEHNNPTLHIPDTAFTRFFAFLDAYQWRLDDGPLRHDNEINHSLLGHVFEQYINQQQMGAYYTREDVTDYIAKNTILSRLFDAVEDLHPEAFKPQGKIWRLLQEHAERYIHATIQADLHLPMETTREYSIRRVRLTALLTQMRAGKIHNIDDLITYNLDIALFAQDVLASCDEPSLLYAFYTSLRALTILDPTCGSGAFLFAALRVLEPLYDACIQRMSAMITNSDQQLSHDFSTILAQVQQQPNRRCFVLKLILAFNLYGVDFMEEAVDICRLRLYLELLVRIERAEDMKSASSLKHNIRAGNALVGSVSTRSLDAISDIPGSKQELVLREQFDRDLAREYGIDLNDVVRFEQWRVSHKPFHWCVEFRDIISNGGFDVILGNPPYVEYEESRFLYTLPHFETRACANLYPLVVERSHTLLSPQGRHGMILPLAAFATRNMIPFIEGFLHWFPCSWLSFYHFRPSMLFSGGKVASIPTVIYLAKNTGQEQRFSTAVAKWSAEQRKQLFSSLSYSHITTRCDPENRHYYPKFGSSLENALLEKLLCHTTVASYLAKAPGANNMFYRSAGGLYWKVFLNFAWPYQTTSNKQCTFRSEYDRDVFVALFNSSLFWWYYTVTFDTFNLKDYMLFGFRFTYPQSDDTIAALRELCQQLMQDYRNNAKHLKRGETGSYTIYAKKSKTILDEIDRILVLHYGFTDEELDFIINYDIKYRVGQENGYIFSS